LDTSVLLSWIKEKYDAEMIAFCANIGQEEELKGLEKKAKKTGASKIYVDDLQEEFARDFIFPMIQAGAIYENHYFLGTSIARPLIAKRMVDIAREEGAEYIAHGATGKGNDKRVGWVTVNESGSWIYATSRAARKEFPATEPAVRAAACLARRFQDPLGEAAKLDFRVLGVGQGHHEVDQKSLRDELRRQAAACANAVGVDLNRAPAELLELVPGMTDRVAKRIVELRDERGPFPSLAAAEKMPGMNKRVWEQAAGFFRVFGGENPLDETGVHPQDYARALALIEAAGSSLSECIANPEKLAGLDLDALVGADRPKVVLEAIVKEFDPRRLNPRGQFKPPKPGSDVELLEEPKAGMKVRGIVTNAASFGVFVDIGAEQDGLLHVSQLPEEMIADDRPKVAAGAELTVYITHFDSQSGKLSLSMREVRETSRQRRAAPASRREGGASRPRRPFDDARPRPERAPVTRTFGPDRDEQVRARKQVENMSLPEKLAVLGDKFRTKV
jgi:uncharacterized protein